MPRKKPKKSKYSKTNTLRVIGGNWRSRKLAFSDAEGLRPTPDRIRETLFNWLQREIHGARCLDLFAGSGILGIEALSRGAAEVVFVEKNKAVAKQLQENLKVLKADSTKYELHQGDALAYLNADKTRLLKWGGVFTIIYLDPPYRQNLLAQTLTILCDKDKGLIDKNTLIYLEHEAEESFEWSAYGLKVLKEASAGQVKSYLLQRL